MIGKILRLDKLDWAEIREIAKEKGLDTTGYIRYTLRKEIRKNHAKRNRNKR